MIKDWFKYLGQTMGVVIGLIILPPLLLELHWTLFLGYTLVLVPTLLVIGDRA